MKVSWTWREGVRFALAKELLSSEGGSYEMNLVERLGSLWLRPLYKLVGYVSKHIRKPAAISLFTVVAALLVVVVFYNIPALVILGKLFPSKTVRFLFFFYIEANILAMGCCAFGRFHNHILVALWKEGKLVPVFPGDKY